MMHAIRLSKGRAAFRPLLLSFSKDSGLKAALPRDGKA
jgi:hypothetical protein